MSKYYLHLKSINRPLILLQKCTPYLQLHKYEDTIWLSRDTLTDVSSCRSDLDIGFKVNGRSSPGHYDDIADDDLDSFKMPDISLDLDLDLGSSSFMDEIMSVLDTKRGNGNSSGNATPVNETAPLIPDR